jgi:hypothetical protein
MIGGVQPVIQGDEAHIAVLNVLWMIHESFWFFAPG